MALFDRFKKKDKESADLYPTLTPGMDSPGMGPAATPTTPLPGAAGLPALPTASTPTQTAPGMDVLQNKIDMLISKIDALKSALDMLNQKISQMETQQKQVSQPNPVDQRFDIYGGSESKPNPGTEQQSSDYSSGSGWQF